MIDEILAKWDYFHDWYLDVIEVGHNVEPRRLTIGLYRAQRRVNRVFNGVTSVSLSNFGMLNIVSEIKVVHKDDIRWRLIMDELERCERLSKRRANNIMVLYSSLGAELSIELDSLTVEPISG